MILNQIVWCKLLDKMLDIWKNNNILGNKLNVLSFIFSNVTYVQLAGG
jgi:hypothetical protein